MSTVLDVVGRALRLIRVQDPDEPVEPRNFETAVIALNAMMNRLEATGTAVGWSDVSNPSEIMPTAPELDEFIAAYLGLKLAPEYEVDAVPYVVQMANEGMTALLRDRIAEMPIRQRPDIPWPSAGWWRGTGRGSW